MIGNYRSVADVIDNSGSYPKMNDRVYDEFIECLSEVEPLIYGL